MILRRRALLTVVLAIALLAVVPVGARAIVGGAPAQPGRWSFTAVLELKNSRICGAVVVAPDWVATAAHCVDPKRNPTEYQVVLGRYDLDSSDGVKAIVAAVHVHPRYTKAAPAYDVALLRLMTPTAVMPIPVPAEDDNRFEVHGSRVLVTGWGARVPLVGLPPKQMHEVELKVVSDPECRTRRTGMSFDPDTEVCAADLLKDSCQGDSGGPMFALDGGRPLLIGLVSHGFLCAVPEQPGLYAEVNAPAIRSWLRTIAGV